MSGGSGSGRMNSWSSLPDDIIRSIMGRLCYSDQIRFRAMCKKWRSVDTRALKHGDKLPWIMSFNSTTLSLYDPSHKRNHNILYNDEIVQLIHGGYAIASKSGWVLFAKSHYLNFVYTEFLFFYNPFTGRIMRLPKLPMSFEYAATFTSIPTSRDCMVYVVNIFRDKKISVNTYGLEDETWITHWCPPDLLEAVKPAFTGHKIVDVEYVSGVLYFAFSNQRMCAFNVALQEWKTYSLPYSLQPSNYRLIDYDGRLLMTYRRTMNVRYALVEFDLQRFNWLEVENMDKMVLFTCHDNTSCMVSIEPVVEAVNELANTIKMGYSEVPTAPIISLTPQIIVVDAREPNLKNSVLNIWVQPSQLE